MASELLLGSASYVYFLLPLSLSFMCGQSLFLRYKDIWSLRGAIEWELVCSFTHFEAHDFAVSLRNPQYMCLSNVFSSYLSSSQDSQSPIQPGGG